MSNKIPKIGIVGWSTGDNSFGTTKSYLHFLSFFGDVRILTPKNYIDEDLDLVVMPGGKDTLPARYGQAPGYYNSDPDQFKEHFALVNLPMYIEAGIPIFGICLGMQMLCVHFGGELVQNIDLGTHGYSDEKSAEGRGQLVNDIIFTPKFTLLEIQLLKENKLKRIKTCSLHHQGVKLGTVPDELQVIAYTKDDIVEFIQHETLPIAGCQSHPEEDFSPLSIHLIEKLIKRSPNLQNENERHTLADKV